MCPLFVPCGRASKPATMNSGWTEPRRLFRGILADDLAVPDVLENSVFPDSAGAQQMRNLIRG
jgi:hypothetical protein